MIGLYAGSFDPVHLGHLDIIEAASDRCSELYVVAVWNPAKHDGLLSLEDRRQLLEACVCHLHNVNVTTYEGLLVRLADQFHADALIRGAVREHVSEIQMAVTNNELGTIPTLLISCKAEHRHISSSLVRRMLIDGGVGTVESLVPAAVYDWLGANNDHLSLA